MKVQPRRAEAALAAPDDWALVLLHGADPSQVARRAAALTRRVAGDLNDPFRVVIFAGGKERIADAAAFVPLTGGRGVVRVRDAGDGLAGQAEAFLASPGPALVLMEADALPGRSKLRAVAEAAPRAAAIPCHPPDAADLPGILRERLAAAGVRLGPEALARLTRHVTDDPGALEPALELLALCQGVGQGVDQPGEAGGLPVALVAACLGEGGDAEDAVLAALAGDAERADRCLAAAGAEGASPVGLIRIALMHVHRLLPLAGRGATASALAGLRPPVFGRAADAYRAALARLPPARLRAAASALGEAEALCKSNGMPADTLCHAALASLAAD